MDKYSTNTPIWFNKHGRVEYMDKLTFQKRSAGVLMPVSSLPGPFGIGVFGQEACDFIDALHRMGFRWWQVLPFNPVDSGNSPYASASAFAGNILFIDPRALQKKGLLTAGEVEQSLYSGSPYTADYAFANKARLSALRKAYTRLTADDRKQIEDFSRKQLWVEEYALYMAVKEANGGQPWWEWRREEANYDLCIQNRVQYAEETGFWVFVQQQFFEQWNALKAYAAEKGIKVIGDMPIYVSMDSCDVWSHLSLFQLDPKTFRPTKVAGVPPDYFCEDGQLWGNPLYEWKKMKADGYQWWIERIAHSLRLYDAVRIDHFRGFASYWAVPADSETAKEGEWEPGPGQDLFDALKRQIPCPAIIAEDLGVFGEDVVRLLKSSGYPGLRVIQFGFDPSGDSTHLPHNYPFNCVAYLGTHDNNTLLGWLWEASPQERAFALDYCGFAGNHWGEGGFRSDSCRKIIEAVWRSPARTAVIAFQDMCGFGSDARMNIPGQPENNWRFRTTADTIAQLDEAYFRKINALFRRV